MAKLRNQDDTDPAAGGNAPSWGDQGDGSMLQQLVGGLPQAVDTGSIGAGRGILPDNGFTYDDILGRVDANGVPAPGDPNGGWNPGDPTPNVGGLGRSGESPRERGNTSMRSLGGGAETTPNRPSSPTPQAGSSFNAQSGASMRQPSSGVIPFEPMGSGDIGATATPSSRGLFGSSGGLTGGGLGVPLDPTSNQRSNPIDMLIDLLSKSR